MQRVLAIAALASCAEPRVPVCSVRCEADGRCPLGLTCGEGGLCHGDDDEACPTICVGCVEGGPYNFAFVTSAAYPAGSLGGLEGADARCGELARDAGLAGEFRAWLSTSTVDAASRLVTPAGGPANGWIRTDRRPFAASLDGLLAGEILTPLRIDEAGARVPQDQVATGTSPVGTLVTATLTAGDWTEESEFWAGDPAGTTTLWTFADVASATATAHLYCFGIDHDRPLPIDPFPGRAAFLSRGKFSPPSGIDVADDLCDREATALGLSGALALLATSSDSALSRFDLDGPTWVRLDGVPWTERPQDLASVDDVLTTLNVDSAGAYHDGADRVWTGAPIPSYKGTFTCDDWSSTTPDGVAGHPAYASYGFFSHELAPCTSELRLYCLED